MARNSPTNVEMYLRAFGRDVLGMWLLILESLAIKYSKALASEEAGDLKSRRVFVRQNAEFQGELGKFFAPYHRFCPACNGCCYNPQSHPYRQLDMFLYGLPDNPATDFSVSPFLRGLGVLLFHYFMVLLRWLRIRNPGACKAEFVMECECIGVNGCTIPWGRRPNYCVVFVCELFFKNMDWAEYWRYLRLISKYLLHLTVSLMAVAAEWRQQAASALKGQNAAG